MPGQHVEGSDNLLYRLMGLGMAGAVLHIGAHPDDEDIGLLSYLAHKFGVRVVYWSATRGEGGQNRIGAYREEALGIYRTWESLGARAVDGGQCLFGPFYDFGYSKTADEGMAKWGKVNVIREVVRAIRLVQPQIIVARWQGIPGDYHGQHQTVGQAALQAFEAAGDPTQFSELEAQGLAAWQPLKFYHSMDNSGGDLTSGGAGNLRGYINPDFERAGVLRINTGEFDPISDKTYQEQAWLAYNNHQSQAMGLAPAPGNFFYYFSLHKSLVSVPTHETNFFDGLDPSLTGLADYPGRDIPSLRMKLEEIKATAKEAFQQFRANAPNEAFSSLMAGKSTLEELRASLKREDITPHVGQALDQYLTRKITDFEAVAVQCLGLKLECLSDHSHIIPGQQFRISARLWNQRKVQLDQVKLTPQIPEGWTTQPQEPKASDNGKSSTESPTVFDTVAPETADLTCPYWLTSPKEGCTYHWPQEAPASQPFGSPQVQVECEVVASSHHLTLRQAVVHRQAFPGGFRELPVAVVPPISLQPAATEIFLPVLQPRQSQDLDSDQDYDDSVNSLQKSSQDQTLELQVLARNNSGQTVQGELELEVPPGWQATCDRAQLVLKQAGETQDVHFTVTIPANTPVGHYPLQYRIRHGQRNYATIVTPVRMGAPGLATLTNSTNCIKEAFILTSSQVVVHLIPVQFAPGLRYAYIQGAKEELLDVLKPFGITFHLITDDEMSYLDLSDFDAVVIGPNAYLIREALRKNAGRFLDYVRQGGTLIVQYQGYAYQKQNFTPYPFEYNQPHDRVTYEDAPVTILDPDYILFRLPNTITSNDFDGWVRDRGLYFFSRWDKRYHTRLACSDPGEAPQEGGLIECQYGQGTFLYCGYSFFRQLPAGVSGAFRLFANILALPLARIVERREFLEKVSLFSSLTNEQLEMVARIMSERWAANGTYICRQGDEGHELYIVYQGEVEIIQEVDGQEQIIFLAKVGDCVGELSVLGDIPRTASMRARGDVHLLVIESGSFQSLLIQHPELSIQMFKLLLNKVFAAGGQDSL